MNNNDSNFLHTSSNTNSKRQKRLRSYATINIQTFHIPLISPTTGPIPHSINLEPDRVYTIGREKTDGGNCDFIFNDCRVSRKHCQILYDSVFRKIYILDGVLLLDEISDGNVVGEFRRRMGCFDELEGRRREKIVCGRIRVSTNGVFVNGIRIRSAAVRELCAGDEVCFGCGNVGKCGLQVCVGFVILGLSFKEEVIRGSQDIRLESRWVEEGMMPIRHSQGSVSSGNRGKRVFAIGGNDAVLAVNSFPRSKHVEIIGRAKFLLDQCRHILQSDDPVSCIRHCDLSRCGEGIVNGCKGDEMEVNIALPVSRPETNFCQDSHCNQKGLGIIQSENATVSSILESSLFKSVDKISAPQIDVLPQKKNSINYTVPPGKNFYLNRLQFMEGDSSSSGKCISLPELLHPIESISRMFIATFTSDILWFLSYCEIPHHLPITIACHNAERCWNSSPEKRCAAPYPYFPNLVVVFPSFPEAIAFGNDRKRQGIACHHPKLLVLQREDSIRVIITSANLVANQWRNVTNTVWWQDFPSRSDPDLLSLFAQVSVEEINQGIRSDFAAQLAGFMATLIVDVPSQAHWIAELTKYNFEGATGHLVASVPGIHSRKIQYVNPHEFRSLDVKFLGSVEASVVGLSHLFHSAADKNGLHLKKLATFLKKAPENSYGMVQVVLRRNTNVPVDANCVSVFVSNQDHSSEEDCVQLGFLPRYVAKWVSPLWDSEFFRFFGYISPKEALAVALGGSSMRVQLTLHVLQGRHFPDMMRMMQPEHVFSLSSLIASIQRCTGIWRLQEVLRQFKWPEMEQSDFIYGSSSVGSVNAQFLAAFSAAAGKRSLQAFDSEESDPEWGCWTASQELRNPSIRIIFPTIDRVKNACNGILPSRRILCFSEKTWQRLRSAGILHDALPHPHDRLGHPMHTKVARRCFSSKMDSSSCGWVYCGSHNFSAAAWGRTISNPFGPKSYDQMKTNNSMRLHVCNYELGIIFTFPPSQTNCHANSDNTNLDDIILPFVVPAPKYRAADRPATGKAMREALVEIIEKEGEKIAESSNREDVVEEVPDEEEDIVEATDYVVLEKEDEKAYAEKLWSQVDSSQSC